VEPVISLPFFASDFASDFPLNIFMAVCLAFLALIVHVLAQDNTDVVQLSLNRSLLSRRATVTYRLVSSNKNYWNVGEIQLQKGGVNVPIDPGTCSTSSTLSSGQYSCAKLFDGATTIAWTPDYSSGSDPPPYWIQWKASGDVDKLRVYQTGWEHTTATLKRSLDGGSTWEDKNVQLQKAGQWSDVTLQPLGGPAYTCKCPHGTAATGTACTKQDEHICNKCDAGYHPNGNICEENTCRCPNGDAPAGANCPTHDETKCTSCKGGYFLKNDDTCQAQMRCNDAEKGFVDSGSEITGLLKSCPITDPKLHAGKFCATGECLVQPDRYTCCRSVECTCADGKATKSAKSGGAGASLCEADDTEDCESCDAGYYLSATAGLGSQTCLQNVCTCSHGTATIATGGPSNFCAENGQHDCNTCKAGYHLNEPAAAGAQTCQANVCTCPNGVAAVAAGNAGTLCEADGTEDCSLCNAGWSLSGPSGPGLQSCEANTCSQTQLPTGDKYDTTYCKSGMTTGQSCHVSCAAGYTGGDSKYECHASGSFTGSPPNCTANKCNDDAGAKMFTRNMVTNNCTNATTNKQCTATCNNGYTGKSQTYECTASGFVGVAMECNPDPCDASHDVANGKSGTCTTTLESGGECKIECDQGYHREGVTYCLAGTLQSVAKCEPTPCDASEPPKHGTAGDCSAELASGSTCKPNCEEGYTLSGPSRCLEGALDAATCQANLQCHLVYTKACQNTFGYWSDEPQHLDYPGCETFCNIVNSKSDVEIFGCELAAVPGEARATTGKWCFAHSTPCVIIHDAGDNAAAKCVPFAANDN
jgi:hypothetical protein